jgi:hypothetical protein
MASVLEVTKQVCYYGCRHMSPNIIDYRQDISIEQCHVYYISIQSTTETIDMGTISEPKLQPYAMK